MPSLCQRSEVGIGRLVGDHGEATDTQIVVCEILNQCELVFLFVFKAYACNCTSCTIHH